MVLVFPQSGQSKRSTAPKCNISLLLFREQFRTNFGEIIEVNCPDRGQLHLQALVEPSSLLMKPLAPMKKPFVPLKKQSAPPEKPSALPEKPSAPLKKPF